MLLVYQIIYVSLGIVVFLYGAFSKHRAPHAFSLAVAVNIFPLAFSPYFSMDEARVGGIPLAYVPIMFAGFALLLQGGGFKVRRVDQTWLAVACIFLSYATVTTFGNGFDLITLSYYMAWPFNFMLFLIARYYFSRQQSVYPERIVKNLIYVLVAGCIVGLFRFASGIALDANFMPLINRNGTVIFIVMLTPLLLYLYDSKQISTPIFIFSWVTIFAALLFIFSRSGLIGFILGTALYYFRSTARSLVRLTFVAVLFGIVLSSGVADSLTARFSHTASTLEAVTTEGEIVGGDNDYNRWALLNAAIKIIENNFLFGTGLGIENYRKAFRESGITHHLDSKAHNFYLSYFAELGLLGFSLLLILLSGVYRRLAALSTKHRAFRVSFIVVVVMMTMNEYILLPELWFFFGMLAGISLRESQRRPEMRGTAIRPQYI